MSRVGQLDTMRSVYLMILSSVLIEKKYPELFESKYSLLDIKVKSHSCLIRLVLLTALAVKPILLPAQYNLLAGNIFQSTQESSEYKCYTEKFLLILWVYKDDKAKVVDIDTMQYGFYNSCELPSLDSLRKSGVCYFELDSSDFVDKESTNINIHNACSELNFIVEGKETRMNVYYSSRQQYATYKEVKTLPHKIRRNLKKRKIKLNFNY
jgi:hypothetical protein